METAFFNRVGFTTVWNFTEVNFYPKSKWLQRVHPFVFARAGTDRIQNGDEELIHTGLRLNVTRQGFFNFSHSRGHETWRATRYRIGRDFNTFGNMQAFRWLFVSANFSRGPAIFYGDTNHFQGRSQSASLGATIQANQHFSLGLDFFRTRFWRPSTGEQIYAINILNARTTYQFDKHFLVRVLGRYDSSLKRLLTDFLASYEFVPGTVAHVGYGALFEKGYGVVDLVPGVAASDDDFNGFRQVNRGLFLKASYLRRF